jgi:hypothetical protein
MKDTETTITAETAETGENDVLCDLCVLGGECRGR